jgi:integrase
MFIKKPTHGRASYALVGNDGKTVSDPRIDAVNADLRAGVARDLLDARMRAIRDSFKPPRTPLSASNEKLVHELHRKKLQKKPDLANPDGLLKRLLRAAEYLGNVSVREATEEDIYAALSKIDSPARRYETRRAVNEMLKYCQRPFTLYNPVPDRPEEIAFIRIADFLTRSAKMRADYRTILGALFATGCRWAELPVAALGEGQVSVSRQLKPGPKLTRTKNKKSRTAPILPPLQKYVDEYRRLSREERYSACLSNHKRLYYACKKFLGVRLHDLRHSYCVEWGAKGCSTADLAQYIGDTEEVTERHYRNYCLTSDAIERALKRWK